MPLLILLLGLAAVVVAYKIQLFTPQAPQTTTTTEDLLKSDIQKAAERTQQALTQGQPLSQIQAQEVAKWSSVATLAGTGTAVAVSSFSSLTLAAAGPIGAAVASLIVAFSILRGTAHIAANELTSKIQTPFDGLLARIIDEKDAAFNQGYATKQSLLMSKTAVQRLWNEVYVPAAERLAQQGKDFRLVVDQSYCWYLATSCPRGKSPDPRFPEGFLNRLLSDIDKQIASLR